MDIGLQVLQRVFAKSDIRDVAMTFNTPPKPAYDKWLYEKGFHTLTHVAVGGYAMTCLGCSRFAVGEVG
jgi:hypothetical protein